MKREQKRNISEVLVKNNSNKTIFLIFELDETWIKTGSGSPNEIRRSKRVAKIGIENTHYRPISTIYFGPNTSAVFVTPRLARPRCLGVFGPGKRLVNGSQHGRSARGGFKNFSRKNNCKIDIFHKNIKNWANFIIFHIFRQFFRK